MSDTSDNIIVDTATRIFQDLCEPSTVNEAEQGVWPKTLWDALEESGLPLAWVPDDLGGAGAAMPDGFAVLRVAGRFAAPVPLAETLMAGWLLARAGITAPNGPLTVTPCCATTAGSPAEPATCRSPAMPAISPSLPGAGTIRWSLWLRRQVFRS